jgi:tetratricopeptide (TPR) repeat protein
VAQGDWPGALAAYRKSLTIAKALATRDPANIQWQRDLSVSHTDIGDVLVAQGDRPGALSAYRKALAIREALAARDPANTQSQRDLSSCLAKLASHHEQNNHYANALRFATRSLRIDERLSRLDPTNVMWRQEAGISRAQVARLLRGASPDRQASRRKSVSSWKRSLCATRKKDPIS